MVVKYFHNEYKWKSKDSKWEYEYYKGKRNLKELQFILDIIFDVDLEAIETRDVSNDDGEVIGATVVGSVDVCADFNGMNQGSGRSDIYIAFTLCKHGFYYNQSQSLKGLNLI